jgi:PRTRC genetic system protein E
MNQTETTGLFSQLMPMLSNRTVILTVAATDREVLTVSIIPKKLKDDENEVLSVPLCATGTAEELDRDLPRQLRDFVDSHAATSSNLARIKQELDAAEKAAEEARKEKLKGKKLPVADKAAAPKPEPQGTLGLFDEAASGPEDVEVIA